MYFVIKIDPIFRVVKVCIKSIALFDKLTEAQTINNMSIWTDTTPSGERKHSVWREQGKWTSIQYAPSIGEEDRLIIDIAFNHLYYNSAWFHEMCCAPKIGMFVRNGFHFSGNDTQPHITFQFKGYGDVEVDNTYYHAYFDRTTKQVARMTLVNTIPLF